MIEQKHLHLFCMTFMTKRQKRFYEIKAVSQDLTLSASDLSVFYLHSDSKKLLKAFNDIFLKIFDIPTDRKLPFVLFFKMVDKDAKDVEVVELEQSNIMLPLMNFMA